MRVCQREQAHTCKAMKNKHAMKDIKHVMMSLLLVIAGGMSLSVSASEMSAQSGENFAEATQSGENFAEATQANKVSATCEADRVRMGYPYHYCKCHEEAIPFFYTIEAQITDTVWFWAEIEDLRQGISAYWFADCSVTMELYAYCTSKEPTISMTVGKDQMREKDMTEINRKLDEMGAKSLIGQNMSHLGICTGYGKVDKIDYRDYAPLVACSSWAQVQYGGALKVGLFGGYMENWGAGKDLRSVYAAEGGTIDNMWRVSPNVQYTVGNMNLGLEYELTTVAYGDRQPNGIVNNTHNVSNHRLLLSVMYAF